MANTLRKEIRKAIVAKLQGDSALQALFPSGKVTLTYRPPRAFVALPIITMFDSGDKADNIVPLYDRDYQIDVWTQNNLDLCEDIAERVEEVLDHQPLASINGDVAQVVFLMLTRDLDIPTEDADLSRKTLIFRILAYSYTLPEPFSIA